MINKCFEELKQEIIKLRSGKSLFTQNEIFENIESNEFLGSLTPDEAAYLINELNINTDWVEDDGKTSFETIKKEDGGINLNNIEYGIKDPNNIDEWDLIQPEKKEKHTGFLDAYNQKDESILEDINKNDLDFLIDMSPEEDDSSKNNTKKNTGFLGLVNNK